MQLIAVFTFEGHFDIKGPLISLCRIISVECPTNLNFPLLTSNQNKGSPKQPISMKFGSKFVGHSTEIIGQSKIKGPLKMSCSYFKGCNQLNHQLVLKFLGFFPVSLNAKTAGVSKLVDDEAGSIL